MKKLMVVLGIIALLFAIGCSGSGPITGSDSNQTLQQNDNSATPSILQAETGDPDDVIDGNRGGG